MIILLYGQPASGKTTIADALVPFFPHNTVRIDGDVWRDVTQNKDYSKEGRVRNLKGAFDMAIYLERCGFISLMSFVTPYDELRQYLCDKSNEFVEIYLSYSGDRGRTDYFAKDFEEPKTDCLRIDTSVKGVDECVSEVIDYIKSKTKNFNGNLD